MQTTSSRPKLTLRTPTGHEAQTADTAWTEARRTAAPIRIDAAKAAARTAACENGDGRGADIASFLAPVLDHFESDDVDAAALAAFTRKLVEGGRPRRAPIVQTLRAARA